MGCIQSPTSPCAANGIVTAYLATNSALTALVHHLGDAFTNPFEALDGRGLDLFLGLRHSAVTGDLQRLVDHLKSLGRRESSVVDERLVTDCSVGAADAVPRAILSIFASLFEFVRIIP